MVKDPLARSTWKDELPGGRLREGGADDEGQEGQPASDEADHFLGGAGFKSPGVVKLICILSSSVPG